jgi:hypothetical protein
MLRVYAIRPFRSGYADFMREAEAVEFPALSAVGEYIDLVRGQLPDLRLDEAAAAGVAARLDRPEGGMVLVWVYPDGSARRELVCGGGSG